jgi:class 3 adenylate cyclase
VDRAHDETPLARAAGSAWRLLPNVHMPIHRRNRRQESETPEAPHEKYVTLLFCDVVRSTELSRRLGDRAAYDVIRSFHEVVLRASAPLDGEELERRGDGVLLAFESPEHAVESAIEIQRRLLQSPQVRGVSVRIGVHHGPALRVAYGYFGGTVILSARIAEEAAPGEILVSAALVRRLVDRKLAVEAGRWVSLKGIPEPSLVFPLSWWSSVSARSEPPCPSPAQEALLLTLDRMRESRTKHGEASCMLDGAT